MNPNEWFNSVELLAARHISMEPVQYVSNIYRYYWSYQALQKYKDLRESFALAKESEINGSLWNPYKKEKF
jgi:hypothetical protein